MAIFSPDGDYGTVELVIVVEDVYQPMYNLTVADVHTFAVSEGEWVVHNCTLDEKYSNVDGRMEIMLGMGAGDGKLNDIPHYGSSWNGGSSKKTYGILEINGEDVPLQSGYRGPAQNMKVPGADGNLVSHVEAHVGAITRSEPSITKATLFINQAPCSYLNGSRPTGCSVELPRFLREGFRLTVIAPDGYQNVFTGLPD